MNDVTGVVLTTGEATTQEAIEALKKQTLPLKEIIVVENVTPLHRAVNEGVRKVKTDFFVQVDADMILDENCVEDLRVCMQENVGIVTGLLRDVLIARVSGVKMFRRECFEKVQFKDCVSPAFEFAKNIAEDGWTLICALKFKEDPSQWHTFGEHKPTYTPLYAYSKHLLMGRMDRHRKDFPGCIWYFNQLQNSGNQYSLIARIALAHGIFLEGEKDQLKPFSETRDFDFLRDFLKGVGVYNVDQSNFRYYLNFRPEKMFKKFYKLGIVLRNANAFPAFEHCMNLLRKSNDVFAGVAKIGLCHGIFLEDFRIDQYKKDYYALKEILPEYNFMFILRNRVENLMAYMTKRQSGK